MIDTPNKHSVTYGTNDLIEHTEICAFRVTLTLVQVLRTGRSVEGGLATGSKEDRSMHNLRNDRDCSYDIFQTVVTFPITQGLVCVVYRKFNEMYSGWRRDNDDSEEIFWAEVRCLSESLLQRAHAAGRGYASTTCVSIADLLDAYRYMYTCIHTKWKLAWHYRICRRLWVQL